jgi:hypothetical protein
LIIARAFTASTNVKDEVEVFIDGKSVMIEQGAALIQACEKAGADVCSKENRQFYRKLIILLYT